MKFQIRNTHRNLIPQKFPKFARSELDKNFYSSQQRAVEWKLFVNCQNPFNFSQKLRNYVWMNYIWTRARTHVTDTGTELPSGAARCSSVHYKNMLSISCSQTFDGKACEESRRETKAERICVSPFPSSSWNEKTKGK